jgi:AmmeMemoRadiSam system protein B
LTPQQLAQLAEHCKANVLALFQGATPSYYTADAPDGNVTGITIVMHFAARSETPQISQIAMRPGLPLQSTLFSVAEAAARMIKQSGWDRAALAGMRIDLAVLYDPAMHGTVAAPDVRGLDPARRAVFVRQQDRNTMIFDPRQPAAALVDLAARHCEVTDPESALVYSVAIQSTAASTIVTHTPRPAEGPSVRPAAVAGSFYPADPGELGRMLDGYLAAEAPPPERWPAVMVPHAGLVYSGRLAADVLRRVVIPDRVIVIGPKHTRLGLEWAVAPHATWSIPGATIPSDPELARHLCQAIDGLHLDAAAHQQEHAIEVELPILARLAPQARVLGITIGGGSFSRLQAFAAGLAKVLQRHAPDALLVISSDMNHFASDEQTRRLDELALAAMESLDGEQLLDIVTRHHISMCGVLPAVIVMETLRQRRQLTRSKRVGYATSADVSGDRSRVVGYAGMLLG